MTINYVKRIMILLIQLFFINPYFLFYLFYYLFFMKPSFLIRIYILGRMGHNPERNADCKMVLGQVTYKIFQAIQGYVTWLNNIHCAKIQHIHLSILYKSFESSSSFLIIRVKLSFLNIHRKLFAPNLQAISLMWYTIE